MKKIIKGGKISERQKLEQEHRKYNKEMRQIHCHHMQKTFDEYVAYKYGHVKVKKQRILPSEEELYRRPEQNIPSKITSFCTSKPNEKQYTGDLITGIATMHKSNAVPVFNSEQAKDLASMRR